MIPDQVYPVFLKLRGKRCVVVGGGKVSLRKASSLLECGAELTVVSPEFIEGFLHLEGVRLVKREPLPEDFSSTFLAIIATNDLEKNRSIAHQARKHGALVNVVDQPEECDFFVPSCLRRDNLCIAISTGGASPALARRLRLKLEESVSDSYGVLAELLGELRPIVLESVPSEKRRSLFVRLSGDDVLSRIEREGRESAKRFMLSLIEEARK